MAATMTLDEARLAAHQLALRTDPAYRMSYEAWLLERDRGRQRRREAGKPQRVMYGAGRHERLPIVRVWMVGRSHRRFTKGGFTFEDEIRERILEELRPGTTAMWSDPYERLGLAR